MKKTRERKKENALLRVEIRKIRTTELGIEHRFVFRESVWERPQRYEKMVLVFSFFTGKSIAPSSRRQGTLSLLPYDDPIRVALL
ncbi:hypothetical protein ACTRXD_00480 [Nitrospira sp. T9]|uniref:hypothetical protein n=1 Tax=unclassified Nitrospira TaxID=2652172 RepID=UPI003F99E2CC